MTANLGIGKLRDMQNDIKNLRSKVADYYAQYGDIPARKDVEYTNIANIEKAGVISSAVDTGKFYVIELSSLDNLTLTYGKDYEQVKAGSDPNSLTDLYIINEASHNIFYVAGIPLDGEWFYTDYTSDQIDTEEIPRRVIDGVTIPDGFYYAGGTKEEGLVISDVEGDDLENSKGGNQFVWIPVGNYDEFVRQEGYAGGNIASMLSNSGEADSAGKNENQNGDKVEETGTTKQEAMEMYKSVKTYRGFYIGRFETGKDEEGNVVIRKGVTVYNKVPWSVTESMTEKEEIDGTENGAIEQARYFDTANGYTSVTSTLCYGVQWDAALNYIDPNYITNAEAIGKPSCEETSYVRDGTGKGWYAQISQAKPTNTGYYPVNNIYDLAGNLYEWTMESYDTDRRILRGGYYDAYGRNLPSSYRVYSPLSNVNERNGFRICLFINVTEEEKTEVDGVQIPDGFYYAGGSKEEGIVISDVKGDDLDNSKGGNQFVWIPVDNSSDEVFNRVFQRQVGYFNKSPASMMPDCGEADSAGENENQDGDKVEETGTTEAEAMAMYESVKTYGGFYIGRFETGKDEEGNVVIRKGVTPYNEVPWSVTGNMAEDEEIDGTENGAIEQARYFDTANGYTSVTSTLCYGVQWDAAMNFIDPNYITKAEIGAPNCAEDSYVRDSTGKGWYDQDDVTNTGYFQIKNIYDLAGNVYEWTMESCGTDNRVERGGYYGYSGSEDPSSNRIFFSPDFTDPAVGFRITLYL